MNTISIGELARHSGIGRETIRFYERESLLPPPQRTPANYRRYPPAAVARLQFIRRAKALGFTLAEIRELLSLQDAHGDRAQVKQLTASKLAQIRARIDELTRMEAALAEMHVQCSGHGPVRGCPIIETLAGQPSQADASATSTEE
ncbi:MAG TPA: heavy metal-responsive transcriptional regulator [Salinisphaeraceae bacterium]|nr:heavy metal-responsive transcriptional regulator [Salinisphaeraceae bacterium]